MTVQRKQYQVIREPNVMVPMRDGKRLATDVVRPDAPGRFPVLINRGPYGKDSYLDNPDPLNLVLSAQRLRAAKPGRAGGASARKASTTPLFQEALDGYDTVEWAARQPWSTGRLATTGQSYLGATQYTLVGKRPLPPHLQTMAVVSAVVRFSPVMGVPHRRRNGMGWMVPYAILKGRNTLARGGHDDFLAKMDEYVIEPGNFGQPLSGPMVSPSAATRLDWPV